ncbi:MAG TPA: histidine kinase dimerization/phospho-acceptor domain-containing protein [Myxococcaceae bacterium]|nr:histidine kinase dimerization/phospho-acceptor domain-containing protein [Myxococcaceae bacterium]
MAPTARPFLLPSSPQSASALIRAVRWSTAVRLMDSLVHDVRNPLNALAINVEILQEKLSRAAGGEVPATQAKNLQAMREQVGRVNGLLGEFARFLAPSAGAPAVVSLAATVKDAVAVLGHAGRRARVKVTVDVPEGRDAVEAIDPSALGFLVLVPVLRAFERTPEDGQVRVSVRNEGASVVLHVQDGGREEGEDTEVEQALAAAASEYGVEFHVRGSQLRLSFRAGQDQPEP